jgi:acyl-CoA ligase (AMP-forming) (exosortase A-associated)
MQLNEHRLNRTASGSATNVYERIEEPLLERARLRGGKAAVVDGEPYSYEVLARAVRANAAVLLERGLKRGDRAAVYLDKTAEAVVAIYSVWAAGGVLVPVNETLRSRQVQHIIRHSGSAFFISNVRKLSQLQPESVRGIGILSIDMAADDRTLRPAPAFSGGGEPAAILYTSGSTGLPKGILLSHENLLAGTRIVSEYLNIQEDERILSILPFSFDYGLNQLLTSVYCGATLVLQRSHFPPDICRTLQAQAVTAMAAVPSLWIQLMRDHSPFSRMTFPTLRYITNSGGVFPVDLVKRYRAHLPGTRIYLMYGLSEAFRSTYLPPEELATRPHSMGKAIPETEIYVLNERGQECAAGEVGELVHRGPTVALGYWQDPRATAAVFRPWSSAAGSDAEHVVYSGDLVKKDEDGYLYFVGRRDQLIKSSGYRVSPEEVEEIILSSGLVQEAGVCGRQDAEGGTMIVAHVVPRHPDAFSSDDLVGYCRREMPPYMVPKAIHAHDALPRTTTGKIDRNALRP